MSNAIVSHEDNPLTAVVKHTTIGTVAGALVGINAMGIFAAVTSWHGIGTVILAFIFSGMLGGAAGLALAFIFRERRRSLAQIEEDLERAQRMIERGLIDHDDYQTLKHDLMTERGGGPINWRLPIGGAMLAVTLAMLVLSNFVGILGIIPGVILGGGGAAAVAVAQRITFDRPDEDALPEPAQWEQLGSREENLG